MSIVNMILSEIIALPTKDKTKLVILGKDESNFTNGHIYITVKGDLEVGDWCFFYNSLSEVLEINGTSAKIKTYSKISKDDADFLKTFKKFKDKPPLEGEESILIHSFTSSQLNKIVSTTDKKIKTRYQLNPEENSPEWLIHYPEPPSEFIKLYSELDNITHVFLQVNPSNNKLQLNENNELIIHLVDW